MSKYFVRNFTVLDTANRDVFCYWWTESTGGKGSNEVGSILLDIIRNHTPGSVRHIIFHSDNTASQAKNQYVPCSLMHALWTATGNLDTIEIIWPEVGHTDLGK